MMKRGFTLIEVIVTMAIVAILAGMMVPAVWKFWENQEVQTTRDRLTAIKLAMVGDRNLVQNGIRTSYGYVGDHGDIPLQTQISSVKHYVPAGLDSADYLKDAWGNPINYTVNPEPGIAARLFSSALNGSIPPLDITTREVMPTVQISGKFTIEKALATKYLIIKSSAVGWINPPCIDLAKLTSTGGYCTDSATTTVRECIPPLVTADLSIGGPRQVYWCTYSDNACTQNESCQLPIDQRKTFYVHDGMTALQYDLVGY